MNVQGRTQKRENAQNLKLKTTLLSINCWKAEIKMADIKFYPVQKCT